MNLEHAVQIIAKRGFTERQARFLILVARHSGVCVMRQYSAFAGIVFGQKTRKFFAQLVRARFVSTGELSKSCHLDPTQYRAFAKALDSTRICERGCALCVRPPAARPTA